MKIKFANGVTKTCVSPTEQKVFKNNSGVEGWILNLRLIGEITSTELDELITPENISPLEFLTVTENGEDKSIFTLEGYSKISHSAIHHSEDTTTTAVEIQFTKGL